MNKLARNFYTKRQNRTWTLHFNVGVLKPDEILSFQVIWISPKWYIQQHYNFTIFHLKLWAFSATPLSAGWGNVECAVFLLCDAWRTLWTIRRNVRKAMEKKPIQGKYSSKHAGAVCWLLLLLLLLFMQSSFSHSVCLSIIMMIMP